MNCREIKDKFARYLERALPEADTEIVASHVDNCARCNQDYQLFRMKRQLLLATLPRERTELSSRFYAKMKTRLKENTERPAPVFWELVKNLSRMLAVVWFILLLIMVAVNIYIRAGLPIGGVHIVNSIPERSAYEAERMVLDEDKDITSENALSILMSEEESK